MSSFSISGIFRNPIFLLILVLLSSIPVYALSNGDIYLTVAVVFGGLYWILTSKINIEENMTLPIVDKPTQIITIGGEFFDQESIKLNPILLSLQLIISISFLVIFAIIFTPINDVTEALNEFGKFLLTLVVFGVVYEQFLLILLKNVRYQKQAFRIIKRNIATYDSNTGPIYLTEKYLAFYPQIRTTNKRGPPKLTVIPLDSIENVNITGANIKFGCSDQEYIFSIDNPREFESEIQKLRSK